LVAQTQKEGEKKAKIITVQLPDDAVSKYKAI
jgi:hypothetical protein